MPQKKTLIEKMTTGVGSVPSLVVHTLVFIGFFVAAWSGTIGWDTMLLALTTIVSLEAIYLAIFIQMSVNRHAAELAEVSEDVEDIQEDVDEIQKDVDEIQKDVDEIQEDVEDIQEDVEEISDEDETDDEHDKKQTAALEQLTQDIHRVLADLEQLKRK
ncbi:MAG: DUF1003 domain-containing protein [Candidatus Pacebacteria bacterium]|nr:DUF1003 domain-containing protein [Candidatus Paceibacterota bacterium]